MVVGTDRLIVDQIASANRRHYSRGKATAEYELEQRHRKRLEIAVRLLDAAGDPHGRRVLDIGASPESVSALSNAGFSVTAVGLDADPTGDWKRCDRVVADVATALPFHDESFDVVFAGELLEHLFDPIAFLRHVHRVLRTAGRLVVTTPNLATWQDRLRFMAGRSPRHVDLLHPYLWLHIRPFTYDKLEATLAAAGFNRFELRSNGIEVIAGDRRVLLPVLGRVVPKLGHTLIVGCHKAQLQTDER